MYTQNLIMKISWQLKYEKTTKNISHMKLINLSQSLHPNTEGCITIHSSLTSSTYGIGIGKSGLGEVAVSLNPTWCQDDFKNDQGDFFKYIKLLAKKNECQLSYYTSKSLVQCLPNDPILPSLMDDNDDAKDLRKRVT